MKNFSFVAVLLTLLSINTTLAEEQLGPRVVGNGGLIEDLIKAELDERETLTEDNLEQLLENFGLELKNKTIIPAINYFLDHKMEADQKKLFTIQTIWKDNREALMNDINLTRIKFGSCEGNTTCTGDNVYDTIYVDRDAIINSPYGMSFSEFTGLIAHEFVHHFMSEIPSHNDYKLSRFIKKVVLNASHLHKLFTINDMIMVDGASRYIYAANSFTDDLKSLKALGQAAEMYCLANGYAGYLTFGVGVATTDDFENHFTISTDYVKWTGSTLPKYVSYEYKKRVDGSYRYETYKTSGHGSFGDHDRTWNVLTQVKCKR